MIKAESGRKTTVIVNRRTAVFVTRTKHVLVARARDQGWSPAQTIIVPTMKFQAFYRYLSDLTREILNPWSWLVVVH